MCLKICENSTCQSTPISVLISRYVAENGFNLPTENSFVLFLLNANVPLVEKLCLIIEESVTTINYDCSVVRCN